MNISHRLAVAVLAVLLPLSALAQDVPSVGGIRALHENGTVTVYWNPVEGAVKKFRIFYSHASILEQNGTYDDYEDAPGNVLEHTLSSVPPVATLYISVLAVNEQGVESPFFMDEAMVELGAPTGVPGATSTSSVPTMAPSPTVAMESSTLQLLTAVSTSSTGVVLTFTHPLSIPEQFKEQAFTIKSGSGQALPIARYTLIGNQAVLDTAVQTAGRVYQVTIHGSLAGKTPQGGMVPQDGSTAPLLFTGLQTDTSIPEVLNLKLTTTNKNVEITWTPPAATIRELHIQQSTNGGRTFGTAVRMDKSAKGVTIPNVPDGALTILVRTVSLDGSVSRGVQQTITIGKAVSSSSRSSSAATMSKSSVGTKPVLPGTKPGSLPNSGLGLITIISLSGAATGMRFFRKKNAVQA